MNVNIPHIFRITLFILCLKTSLFAFIDLEELEDPFVIHAKKINVAGYTDAFNPTVIRWKNSILLSFRIRDPLTSSTNGVGYLWLDKDFTPIGTPQILDLNVIPYFFHEHSQDPRLVMIGKELYIVFNDMVPMVNRASRRMFVSKLVVTDKKLTVVNTDLFLQFQNENPKRDEKNWTPFDFKGNLYFCYSINPQKIFMPLLGTTTCEHLATTDKLIDWEWGEIRGGTPAILNNQEYLSFFHSSIEMKTVQSKGKKISHYFIGAFTFAKTPPFDLTRISPKPIVGQHFYDGPEHNTWKPLRVVFPGGYISDEKFIWLVYGKQDHEIWVAKISKKGLLDSLIPVHSN